MVVLGMTLGAIGFYFTDSTIWPLIHTVPIWKMLMVMLIGYTILPVPLALDIRGWQEMHPLNSVGWSLLFEYLANILYAIGIRKLSKTTLSIFVLISAIILAHLAITSPNGDVSGGWTLNVEQVSIGLTRMMYPFFAGVLLSRISKPTRIKHAFLYCSLLIIIILYMPRIGGSDHMWLNGIYESICIIIIFPLIVYLGTSSIAQTPTEGKLCKLLGDISYPLYLVHYPIVYFYVAWISNHQGITFAQAWPFALLILLGSIVLAYACLKWYDEPIRQWLRKKMG